jgi:hypothetical protein
MVNKTAHRYAKRIATLLDYARKIRAMDDLSLYHQLYRAFGNSFSDHEIKTAVYWKNKGRQYCPTKKEMETKCFHCPKCKCEMVKATYKKDHKLYACPECFFLITPADLSDSFHGKEEKENLPFSSPFKSISDWL